MIRQLAAALVLLCAIFTASFLVMLLLEQFVILYIHMEKWYGTS